MHLHVPKLFFVKRIQCISDRTGGVGGELALIRLEMPGGGGQSSLGLGPISSKVAAGMLAYSQAMTWARPRCASTISASWFIAP